MSVNNQVWLENRMYCSAANMSRSRGALIACCGLLWWIATFAASSAQAEVRYGQFDVSWKAGELVDSLGLESALGPLDADETVSWRMYVPRSYDPDRPAGLMVYISPTSSGQLRTDWQPVIEEENLIWISANRSGNRRPTRKRILLASLAPFVASLGYEIDPARVYLSGFSGGGKAAGIASIHLANLFKGAVFICGAELWSDVGPEHVASAEENRYVFVTGTRDFNRMLTNRVYKEFGRVGLGHTKLMVIPGMDHRTPDPEHFRESIQYLDRRN